MHRRQLSQNINVYKVLSELKDSTIKLYLEKYVDPLLGIAFSEYQLSGTQLAELNEAKLEKEYGIAKSVDRNLILRRINALAKNKHLILKLQGGGDSLAADIQRICKPNPDFELLELEDIDSQPVMLPDTLLKADPSKSLNMSKIIMDLKGTVAALTDRLDKLERERAKPPEPLPKDAIERNNEFLLGEIRTMVRRKHKETSERISALEGKTSLEGTSLAEGMSATALERWKETLLVDVDGQIESMRRFISKKSETVELNVEELLNLAKSFEEKQAELFQQQKILEKEQREIQEKEQALTESVEKALSRMESSSTETKMTELAQIQEEFLRSVGATGEDLQQRMEQCEELCVRQKPEDLHNTVANLEQLVSLNDEKIGLLETVVNSFKQEDHRALVEHARIYNHRQETRAQLDTFMRGVSPKEEVLEDKSAGADALSPRAVRRLLGCEQNIERLKKQIWILRNSFDVTVQRGAQVDLVAKRVTGMEKRLGQAETTVAMCDGKVSSLDEGFKTMGVDVIKARNELFEELDILKNDQTSIMEHAVVLEEGLNRIEDIAYEAGLLHIEDPEDGGKGGDAMEYEDSMDKEMESPRTSRNQVKRRSPPAGGSPKRRKYSYEKDSDEKEVDLVDEVDGVAQRLETLERRVAEEGVERFLSRLVACETALGEQRQAAAKERSQRGTAVEKLKRSVAGVLQTVQANTADIDDRIATLEEIVKTLEDSTRKREHFTSQPPVSGETMVLELEKFKDEQNVRFKKHLADTKLLVRAMLPKKAPDSPETERLNVMEARLSACLALEVRLSKLERNPTSSHRHPAGQTEDANGAIQSVKGRVSDLELRLDGVEGALPRLELCEDRVERLSEGGSRKFDKQVADFQKVLIGVQDEFGSVQKHLNVQLKAMSDNFDERAKLLEDMTYEQQQNSSGSLAKRVRNLEICHFNPTVNDKPQRVNMMKGMLLNQIRPNPKQVPDSACAVKFHVYCIIDSGPNGMGWLKFSTRTPDGVILDQHCMYYKGEKWTGSDSLCFWIRWAGSDKNLYIEREEPAKPSVSIFSKIMTLGWR